jgi:hypothetical protein
MQGKWLLIGIICLILGATLFGLGLFSYPKNEVITQEIADQTGTSIVKFTPSSNYSSTVTFNITGYYIIENTTWLQIVNQTGAVEYYERISNFPIKAQLSNSSMEYVADFQNLGYSNATVISVNIDQLIETSVYPFIILIIVSLFFVVAGLYVLIISGFLALGKMKKIGKEKNQTLVQLNHIVIIYSLIFWIFSYLIIGLVLPIIAPFFWFLANSLIKTLIIFSVPSLALIVYILVIFYFKRVDLKSNFKQIMTIRKFFYYFQFVFFGALPFFFLILLNSIFYTGFFGFLAICMIYFILIPFAAMPSNEGILIVAFLDFLDEYEVKGCRARFDSLKVANKMIVELIKPFNLAISESCLTSSISYNALVENDTTAISEIIEYAEKTPVDYGRMVPVLQDLVSESDSLDKKGIKALPPFMEKLGKYVGLIIPLISLVVAVILRLFFGISA